MEWVAITLILFFAALTHGSIGFGFPMVATPLLALFMDLPSAILLTLIPTLALNLTSIVSEGEFLRAFRQYLPLAVLTTLGSGLGTVLLLQIDSELFKLVLAAAIFLYLLLQRVRFQLSWIRDHPTQSRVLFGLSAGLLGGLTNTMLPVMIVYTLEAYSSNKRAIIQASNVCFFWGKVIQIALFMVDGRFTAGVLLDISWILVLSLLAAGLGIRLKTRIDPALYRKLLLGLLGLIAITLVVQVFL